MTNLFRSTSTIKRIALANLLLLCLLTISVQAQNNGIADYQKGMNVFKPDRANALPWRSRQ